MKLAFRSVFYNFVQKLREMTFQNPASVHKKLEGEYLYIHENQFMKNPKIFGIFGISFMNSIIVHESGQKFVAKKNFFSGQKFLSKQKIFFRQEISE